jgi:hypothetical protein
MPRPHSSPSHWSAIGSCREVVIGEGNPVNPSSILGTDVQTCRWFSIFSWRQAWQAGMAGMVDRDNVLARWVWGTKNVDAPEHQSGGQKRLWGYILAY